MSRPSDSGRVRTDTKGILSGKEFPSVRDVNLWQSTNPMVRNAPGSGEIEIGSVVRKARFTESLDGGFFVVHAWLRGCVRGCVCVWGLAFGDLEKKSETSVGIRIGRRWERPL